MRGEKEEYGIIQTKFTLGQHVYRIINDEIVKFSITKIIIEISLDSFDKEEVHYSYLINTNEVVTNDNIFASVSDIPITNSYSMEEDKDYSGVSELPIEEGELELPF